MVNKGLLIRIDRKVQVLRNRTEVDQDRRNFHRIFSSGSMRQSLNIEYIFLKEYIASMISERGGYDFIAKIRERSKREGLVTGTDARGNTKRKRDGRQRVI